jgi:leucyl-tRNA synthetase
MPNILYQRASPLDWGLCSAGYGTVVMAVPCGDERDYAFANFFKGQSGMPETKYFANVHFKAAYGSKDNVIITNSDFLNGLSYKEAKKAIEELKINQGKGKSITVAWMLFSLDKGIGENPVYYVNGLPQMIDATFASIFGREILTNRRRQPPLGNALGLG